MIKNFVCDKCGDLEYVLIDGYGFGDRILEDVSFEIRIKNDNFKVILAPGQDDYCIQLNMKYWLKEAHDYVSHHDFGECPKCRGDVDLGEPYDPEITPLPTGTPIKSYTLDEIIKNAKEKEKDRKE